MSSVYRKQFQSRTLVECKFFFPISRIFFRIFSPKPVLQEEEYEWGNPKAKANIPIDELDEKSRKIATASHKWRKELQLKSKAENRPVGMFSGFRAIVHAPKKDSLKRLLEAGCGIVVDLK